MMMMMMMLRVYLRPTPYALVPTGTQPAVLLNTKPQQLGTAKRLLGERLANGELKSNSIVGSTILSQRVGVNE